VEHDNRLYVLGRGIRRFWLESVPLRSGVSGPEPTRAKLYFNPTVPARVGSIHVFRNVALCCQVGSASTVSTGRFSSTAGGSVLNSSSPELPARMDSSEDAPVERDALALCHPSISHFEFFAAKVTAYVEVTGRRLGKCSDWSDAGTDV
jgi:hypothetical protein